MAFDRESSYIIQIIELFKKNEFDEVFKIIKDNDIEPQYSENIISDYAALWVEDKHLVGVFKRLKEIGGEPTGHRTILSNTASNGKLAGLEYLINEGALEKNKKELVYVINGAVMDHELNSLKLLAKHIDLMQYKLLDEINPSIVNRIIDYPDKKILDYLFKENMMQPYLFSYEVLKALENTHADNDYKNYFIKKVATSLGLKNHKKYISQEEYKPGDTAAILKTIQYDALAKDLKINDTVSKKVSKL
jgi:hypothetical protein